MKKTVQVNLNGQVFTLDEDAYDLLSGYLRRIGRLYENSPGKDEILVDIEARICELFMEKQDDLKQVITMVDVKEVIKIMGDPEQFEQETASDGEAGGYTYTEERSARRRLYRDPDSRTVGGVCSGIAYYFGIDPLWIRLAFIVALIFFGTGVLFYILLWIVIPEAKTTAEKLHMKGEPVNINSIGKSIEKEFDAFGDRVSKAGDRFSRGSGQKIEQGMDRFFNFLVEILRRFFSVFGKILGVLFISVGLLTIVALLAGTLGIADMIHFGAQGWSTSMSIYEWGDIVLNSSTWLFVALLGGVLLVGIPFLALAYGGLLLLFPQLKIPYLGGSLLGLWFIGVVLALLTAFSVAQEFSKEEVRFDSIPLAEMGLTADTIVIESGYDPFNISTRRAYYSRNDFMMKIDKRQIILGNVSFDVLPSTDGQVRLELTRSAEGASYESAERRADSISYLFQVDSSKLSLNPYFSFPQIDLLRAQEVELTLRIPEGKTIYLTESVKRVMDDIPNVSRMYDPRMVNHYWQMTSDGLKCLDCEEERNEQEEDLRSNDDQTEEIQESEAPSASALVL